MTSETRFDMNPTVVQVVVLTIKPSDLKAVSLALLLHSVLCHHQLLLGHSAPLWPTETAVGTKM